MNARDLLKHARHAVNRRSWSTACDLLSRADRERPLEAADLERLATAAYLAGRPAESADAWARAHLELLRQGNDTRAARCAYWLAAGLLSQGERARAGAWADRAAALLAARPEPCVEQGYLLLPAGLGHLGRGDPDAALAAFQEAAEVGRRFEDADLVALARHSVGRVLIRMGRPNDGIRQLDEAMVAVDAGDVSPLAAGDVYCSVIEGCLEIQDLRRAREWTEALTHWCESQPGLIAYSGQCLIRRAQILQVQGAWRDAADAVREACARLTRPSPQPASGLAFYQCGELHRLRGEVPEAEEAYRQASRHGRKPQPGLALLRLAQGRIDAAARAIRLALEESTPPARGQLRPAAVEILLAAGDVPAARAAAGELAAQAAAFDTPPLHALASQAHGAVLLADGRTREALVELRRAWSVWQDVEAPYEDARVRVLIAAACTALGDADAAALELDAARWAFERLGATPDLARLDAVRTAATAGTPGLSTRELQVLRLVASGRTNREIGAELHISERTVERHVSNIFSKLDVASRAAATAYAYRHQLV